MREGSFFLIHSKDCWSQTTKAAVEEQLMVKMSKCSGRGGVEIVLQYSLATKTLYNRFVRQVTLFFSPIVLLVKQCSPFISSSSLLLEGGRKKGKKERTTLSQSDQTLFFSLQSPKQMLNIKKNCL